MLLQGKMVMIPADCPMWMGWKPMKTTKRLLGIVIDETEDEYKILLFVDDSEKMCILMKDKHTLFGLPEK